MKIRTGLGQDSHRFDFDNRDKILILAGVEIPDEPPLRGNSDADVVLHALTNAISGVSGVNILGEVADRLCLAQGITDSRVYLTEALKTLGSQQIYHVSISIEAKRPKLAAWIPAMKRSLAGLLGLDEQDVGLTATSGEGLTDFGRGEGIQVLAVVSTGENG